MDGSLKVSRVAHWLTLVVALLGSAAWPGRALGDAPHALLTIADGPVELLRGAARYRAVEGVSLAPDDIVRTGDGARVARIEFVDGRVLDLGPSTQALLVSERVAATHGLAGAAALVIQGWAKLAVPAAVNAGVTPSARLAAPRVTVAAPPAASMLLHVAPDGGALVFAEARGAAVWRRAATGAAPLDATLREGQAWWRPADGGAATVAAGVSTPALRQVPRALADTLPRRGTQRADPPLDPIGGDALEARDLAPWLRAEPALITAWRPRLAALTREMTAAARKAAPARRPASVASRPPTASATRMPRVVPALALRPAAAPPLPAASIALEPTALLPTERMAPPMPTAAAMATLPAAPPRR